MNVRSLLVVAALVSAPVANAQTRKTSPPPPPPPASQPLSIGAWIGYEMGDLDGVQLRVDGILPYQKLTPQIDLSFVGSVGYSRLTLSESVFGFSVDSTANILKLVPAARFSVAVNPQVTLFGDAGLGLYIASLSVDTNVPGATNLSDSSVGLMLRFGAGGLYQLNPRMQLGGSIVLDPMLGDYSDSTFTILAGLTYKL